MNFRISGQKVNIMKETKYLGMIMDEHLTFKNHMDTVKLKLNRANGLLAKLRHYVSPKLLRTIYYAIFEPHLRYGCQLWGQAQIQVLQNIEKIQSKTLRILNFKNPCEPIEQIYKEYNSFTLNAIRTWNLFQNKLSTTTSLPNLTPTKFLKVIKTYISEKA